MKSVSADTMNPKNRMQLDPVTIEVIGNALISIPDEMLAALIKSAYSSNIKERQDCSTAIIDSNQPSLRSKRNEHSHPSQLV